MTAAAEGIILAARTHYYNIPISINLDIPYLTISTTSYYYYYYYY